MRKSDDARLSNGARAVLALATALAASFVAWSVWAESELSEEEFMQRLTPQQRMMYNMVPPHMRAEARRRFGPDVTGQRPAPEAAPLPISSAAPEDMLPPAARARFDSLPEYEKELMRSELREKFAEAEPRLQESARNPTDHRFALDFDELLGRLAFEPFGDTGS